MHHVNLIIINLNVYFEREIKIVSVQEGEEEEVKHKRDSWPRIIY